MKKNSIVKKIYLDSTIKKITKKVKLLGINCKYDPIDLLNTRLMLSLILFVVILIFFKNGFFVAPISVVLFHFLSEYFILDLPIKKREEKLEEEAIFFFEVLALTLESGRNLTSSLTITSKNVDSELSKEFQKSLSEMRLGKSFPEAMTSMKERIPSDAINNAILNIVQASIFGNNIEESLNNQLDFLRDKRILEIKGRIGKLPTKISIISVLFFIPIILLVILSPVLIEFLGGV